MRCAGKKYEGIFPKRPLGQSGRFNFIKIKINLDFYKIKDIINIIKGGQAMDMVPAWMAALEDEDGTFIKKFILASGSLK